MVVLMSFISRENGCNIDFSFINISSSLIIVEIIIVLSIFAICYRVTGEQISLDLVIDFSYV